jgi:hypothetical protein
MFICECSRGHRVTPKKVGKYEVIPVCPHALQLIRKLKRNLAKAIFNKGEKSA